MSQPQPAIIDTGPALNFIATNNQRVLFASLGRVLVPQWVEHEVMSKSRSDRRFELVQRRWATLRKNWVGILSDEPTDELERAVNRMTGIPVATRLTIPQDLGETMVIAHAVVMAETGIDVIVLIDEIRGTEQAAAEQSRLDRLRAQGRTVGTIRLASSMTVLAMMAGSELIKDRVVMRKIYEQMRACDDGLLPIDRTNLLSKDTWSARSRTK